jgi:acetyl esterase/lipase
MRPRALAAAVLTLAAGCNSNGIPPHATVAYVSSLSTALMDVYRPANAAGALPAVVYVHGGAFELGSRSDGAKYAQDLVAKGIELLSIDYRLASLATWPAPLDDLRAALRYARAHAVALGISPDHIGLVGASAGACLASIAALEGDEDGWRPACFVSISGYGDLRLPASMSNFDHIVGSELGHAPPFSAEELCAFSPALCASRSSRALALVVHSTQDGNVSVEQSDALVTALLGVGVGVRYLRRIGYAHGDDVWTYDAQAREDVTEFLLSSLR